MTRRSCPSQTGHHAERADSASQAEWIDGSVGLLIQLIQAPPIPARDAKQALRPPDAAGVYLFSEAGEPRYIGRSRNLRRRITQHRGRVENLATRLTTKLADSRGLTFEEAREVVLGWTVRWICVPNAVARAMLELHAAVDLGTLVDDGGFNDFTEH